MFFIQINAYASEITGTISIKYLARTPEDIEIAILDIPFEMYRIGRWSGDALLLEGEFAPSGVSMEESTAFGRQRQADLLYKYAKEHKLSCTREQTNIDGIVRFDNLTTGVYLIAQSRDAKYKDKGKFVFSPVLISLPTEVNGEFLYNINAEPKIEYVPGENPNNAVPETTKDNQNIQTGDNQYIGLYVIIGFISLMISGIVLFRKKKTE